MTTPPQAYSDAGVPSPPGPVRRRHKSHLWLGAGAAALAVLFAVLAATGAFSFTLPDHKMVVVLWLMDADATCDGGTGGYSDVEPGMPITIRDENNKVIASTEVTDDPKFQTPGVGCMWNMWVNVPLVKQYQVDSGRRGVVTFSREELEKAGWQAEVTLGD
jgi:hypothetical protein